jgi:hypothetical protein
MIVKQIDNPEKAESVFYIFHRITIPGIGTLYNKTPSEMRAMITQVPPKSPWEYRLIWPVELFADTAGEEVIACIIDAVHAVTLDSLTATPNNGQISIVWTTGTEENSAGTRIWRGEPSNGQCSEDPNNYTNVTQVTPLIASRAASVSGATYTYTDQNVQAGKTYCYAVEDVDYNGVSTYHMDKVASARN